MQFYSVKKCLVSFMMLTLMVASVVAMTDFFQADDKVVAIERLSVLEEVDNNTAVIFSETTNPEFVSYLIQAVVFDKPVSADSSYVTLAKIRGSPILVPFLT